MSGRSINFGEKKKSRKVTFTKTKIKEYLI